jgi:hypothetical protein
MGHISRIDQYQLRACNCGAYRKRAGWTPKHWCHYEGLKDVPGPHFCHLFLRFVYRNPPVLGGNDLPLTATDAYGQLLVSDKQREALNVWLTSRGLADR